MLTNLSLCLFGLCFQLLPNILRYIYVQLLPAFHDELRTFVERFLTSFKPSFLYTVTETSEIVIFKISARASGQKC